jgi:hypothetical protein
MTRSVYRVVVDAVGFFNGNELGRHGHIFSRAKKVFLWPCHLNGEDRQHHDSLSHVKHREQPVLMVGIDYYFSISHLMCPDPQPTQPSDSSICQNIISFTRE